MPAVPPMLAFHEACLRNWRALLGAEALLVLRDESLRDEPLALLQAIRAHLGVDAGFHAAAPQERVAPRVNAGTEYPLRPALRELYAPRIGRLAEYLGWDLADWLR